MTKWLKRIRWKGEMIGFILTRHVVCETTNQYWNESYRTIRRFYPDAMIMIIDDNSRQEHVRLEEGLVLTNCFILQSEHPGAAEFLPYYYYLQYKLFEKAVILHDSVFFRNRIDFDKATDKGCFLWHFKQYPTDNAEEEIGLLRHKDHSDELVSLYSQKDLWKGCFGAQTVVSHDFLVFLEEKYHFTRLLPHIRGRERRSHWERVLGCLFTMENKLLRTRPSIFGIIYDYIQWGIPYHVYQEQQGTILRQDVIKVWTSR